jgi:heme/copper-type cytochrome/quinol oxidase subunit 1
MATYQAPPPGATGEDPGRTMGIVGLILAIFCSLIGLVVSIIAYNRSKNAGYKNNIALAGIIVGAVLLVVSLIVNFTVLPGMMRPR